MKRVNRCSIIFSAFMLMLSMEVYAQELSVKKDIISKDKVPYAKVTGTIGMIKPADLLISSLNGDSLLTIKSWEYPTQNPMFYRNLSGYQITFISSKKSIIKSSDKLFARKEDIVDFILQDARYKGFKRDRENEFNKELIVNGAIVPEVEKEFIEKFNNEAGIQWAQQYEAKEMEIVKQMFPLKKESVTPLVKVTPISTREIKNGTAQRLDISNNKNILAMIEKKVVTYAGTLEYTYTFYKYLDAPFTVGDKQISIVVIATVRIDGAFPKMFVNATGGKEQSVTVKDPANAENELTDLLINSKIL